MDFEELKKLQVESRRLTKAIRKMCKRRDALDRTIAEAEYAMHYGSNVITTHPNRHTLGQYTSGETDILEGRR